MAETRTVSDIQVPVGRWAIDELLERYVSWREECHAARLAYQRWAECRQGEWRLAYAGYLAALDREEHAALIYADHIERVRRMHTPSELSASSRPALS